MARYVRDTRAICRAAFFKVSKAHQEFVVSHMHTEQPCFSRLINEDGEYALYTVTLFRRVVDAFKTAARDNSFQVREFSFDAEEVQARAAERNDLERDIEERRNSMHQWCQTSYGEVFGAWVHICAIRLFVESILRYGLPPSFQAVVMKPRLRSEKKIRSILANTFGQGASSHWSSLDDDKGEEAFPYVSFSIEI
jgi:V-type H+-transporting ATPase subunit C